MRNSLCSVATGLPKMGLLESRMSGSIAALSERIQRLEDVEAIWRLKAYYIRACDVKQVEKVRASFLPSASPIRASIHSNIATISLRSIPRWPVRAAFTTSIMPTMERSKSPVRTRRRVSGRWTFARSGSCRAASPVWPWNIAISTDAATVAGGSRKPRAASPPSSQRISPRTASPGT